MAKYYAKDLGNNGIEIGGVRDADTLPNGAIEITEKNYNEAAAMKNQLNRKIVDGEVVERTDEEKNTIKTAAIYNPEYTLASFKISRRSHRMLRHPFTYGDKEIKLEETDLRKGVPMENWTSYIRDAVLAELTGHSILPIRVWTTDEEALEITKTEDLYDLHAAMANENKKILEADVALREALEATSTYDEVQGIRETNRNRDKDTEIE